MLAIACMLVEIIGFRLGTGEGLAGSLGHVDRDIGDERTICRLRLFPPPEEDEEADKDNDSDNSEDRATFHGVPFHTYAVENVRWL